MSAAVAAAVAPRAAAVVGGAGWHTASLAKAARRCARVAGVTAGIGVAGASCVGAYVYATEPGAERAVRFWWHTGPIVARYAWVRFYWRKDEAERYRRYAELHGTSAPKARALIEELRGMFIKVAQVMSVRPEVVPEAYRSEFRKLQDQAPPSRWDPIRNGLERDLGAPLDELFTKVDTQPLGAASIGQAHLVEWRGRNAVVKVQYPEASSMMKADFWCLETLLWLIGEENVLKLVSHVRTQFEVELDYTQEAVHLRELHAAIHAAPAFAGKVAVPEPIPELTNGGVIGMEYLPGSKLELVCRRRLEALGFDLKGQSFDEWLASRQRKGMEKLQVREGVDQTGPGPAAHEMEAAVGPEQRSPSWAEGALRRAALGTARLLGVDAIMWLARKAAELKVRWSRSADSDADLGAGELRQVLDLVLSVHGFQLFFCPYFNGDPHPGNILLLPDGRVGLIDFGQCKELQDPDREAMANLLLALSEPRHAPGADARVAAAFAASGVRTANSDERFMALLPRLMFCGLQPDMLDREKLREVFKGDRVEYMPMHLVMAYRAAMLLRGLCLVLQENVSVAEAWAPWARQWLQERATASVDAATTLGDVAAAAASAAA